LKCHASTLPAVAQQYLVLELVTLFDFHKWQRNIKMEKIDVNKIKLVAKLLLL